MTNDQLDQIIAGLSEAQRGWLLDAWYGSLGWQINYRKKACELGLTQPRSSKLSMKGLAVRKRLMEMNDE